jgi:hypothetical protein
VALVDGSRVRASGRRSFALMLPREVPDVHVDFGAGPADAAANAFEAHVSGSAFGARIEAAGRHVPIALERRAAVRPRAVRGTP